MRRQAGGGQMAGARSWHRLCRGIREQAGASGIATQQGQGGEGMGRGAGNGDRNSDGDRDRGGIGDRNGN